MENREELRIPAWGRLRLHLFCWGVLVLLAFMSCGSRKSAVKIEDSKTKVEEKSTSVGSVKTESGSSDEQIDKQKNKDVEENLKQTITELYGENGQLKSRITTLEKAKTDKSSSNERKSLKTLYNRVDSVFSNEVYKFITITTHKKDKETDANNNSLYITIGVLGFFVIAAVFLYFYIRKK